MSVWETFTFEELGRRVEGGEPRLAEFIRTPGICCAVYRLPAGSKDMQDPHPEDEVYFVIAGRARLRVGSEVRPVAAGSVLFVRATTEHSFFDIEEDLTLIAVFGGRNLNW
jgi:mannose-6-phosphate isomerase-like protein (cupin superfamily)